MRRGKGTRRRKEGDLEVFYDNIGLLGQFADDLLTLLLGKINCDRLLVAIGGEEVGALLGALPLGVLEVGRTPLAGIVAFERRLNLNRIQRWEILSDRWYWRKRQTLITSAPRSPRI